MPYLLVLVLFGSSMLWGESARDYRQAFMGHCSNEGEERELCECMFDRWVAGMDNPESAGAINAARIATRAYDQIAPASAQSAAPYLGQLGVVSAQCAQERFANAFQPAPPPGAQPRQPVPPESAPEPPPEPRHEAATERADRPSEDKIPLTSRPVPQYRPLFADYCMISFENKTVCDCRWQALLEVLKGQDNPQSRTVAYMASHEPGDLAIPKGVSVDRDAAFETFSRYMAKTDRCN